MYGFLILAFKKIVENDFGEDAWSCLLEVSGIRTRTFQARKKYWDQTLFHLFKAYAQELNIKLEQVAYENGRFFHEFVDCAGYGNLLKIQGRTFLEFLKQIDNLHEYLKFSYPHIRSPSFLVVNSSETHITLLYESTRAGYSPYVRGQLIGLAHQIYATDISVDCKPSIQVGTVHKTILEIKCLKGGWSSKSIVPSEETARCEQAGFSSLGSDFFSIFAFHLLITEDMIIQHVGQSMHRLGNDLVGADFRSTFKILRPFIETSFETVS
ncbi:trans-synaptic signaling by soluble gas, modulating synaptic transmission [Sparganum proliferum]